MGHGDMLVIRVYFWNPSPNRVSILDYFFEFSSKQDVYFEIFTQEIFVFDILLSENNKNI